MIFQFTGMSGAGKTTLAQEVKLRLMVMGHSVRVLDGDNIRALISKDLGFSKADRLENMKRMGDLAANSEEEIVLISAINPYKEARAQLKNTHHAKLIWIYCELHELIRRDTKGLYLKALLPDGHPGKITNLTGVNDPFDEPLKPDLLVDTKNETVEEAVDKIILFIKKYHK